MKLTRERKIYLGLLGLGAAVLIADRLFFEPADAGAAPAAAAEAAAVPHQDSPAPAQAASSPASSAASAPSGPGFTSVLSTLGKNPEPASRDPFHPPGAWPAAAVVAEELQGPPLPDFDDFLTNHHINAVVFPSTGQAATALISSKIYHVGDNIDGFTIRTITKTDVEFESPTGEHRSVAIVPTGPLPLTPAPSGSGSDR